MPPICLHLGIAEEVIARLRHPIVDENRGSYYLGSTAPDIRYVIAASREDTHFLSLESEEGASGVPLMFEVHPELSKDSTLGGATRSFVAGYLSHLVTDEAWISRIYRPFFGRASPLGGDPMANFLDRLLQFELDRQERLNSTSMSSILEDMNHSASSVGVSFIDVASLETWREFVLIAASREADRAHFRLFAERYLIWTQQIDQEAREAFFASFDEKLEGVLRMVPREQLQAFREQSVEDSVRVAKEYLG